MRRLFLIGTIFFIVLLAALFAIPHLVPSSVYRDQMEQAAESALGRDVDISDTVSLRVLPRIEARAGASSISNPDGFGDEPFAEMGELRAAVKLWPLISKRVEIDEFVLVDPNIRLVQKKNGENNWTFKSDESDSASDQDAGSSGAGGFTARLGDIRLINGAISYRDEVEGVEHELEKLDISVGMASLDSILSIEGDGELNAKPFAIDMEINSLDELLQGETTSISGDFKTDILSANLLGTITLSDPLSMSLDFDAEVPSIQSIAEFAKIEDLPAASALGSVHMQGQAVGAIGDLTLTLKELKHSGGLFDADGTGVVVIADRLTTDLELDASVKDLQKIASELDVDLPAIEALGSARFSTSVEGPIENLTFSNMSFNHESSLLNAEFSGEAKFTSPSNGANPIISITGPFSVSAPNIRSLAKAAEIELPKGDDIYQSFSLSGDAKGDLTSISVSNAELAFDDISAAGDVTLKLIPNEPVKLSGTLRTSAIDGTPYAVASGAIKDEKEAREATDWQDTPIELAFLEGLEAEIRVVAEALKFQLLDFGETELDLTVRNGALVADLVRTQFYNGVGDAKITANTVNGVPQLGLSADLNGVNFEPFLGALTQMNLVNGNGRLQVSFSGEGATMVDLMGSLSGSANVSIDDGAIQGVNFSKLESLSLESFLSGEWRNALSQDASTEVKDFSSSFSIKDGVARSRDFVFKTDQMRIPGQLNLDLGNRALGLTLTPTSGNKSIGLNGELPPISLSGPWGGDMKLGIDQSWVETKLRQAATDALQDEIGKQLGDTDLGGIISGDENAVADALGNILGVKTDPTPSPTSTPEPEETPEDEATPTPTPSPTSLEDLAKERLNKELGDIFK